jgi:hypothetical protein
MKKQGGLTRLAFCFVAIALQVPSKQKSTLLGAFRFCLRAIKKIFSAVLRMNSNSCSFSWNIYR